jgi:dual specificity protein kinase YAK1
MPELHMYSNTPIIQAKIDLWSLGCIAVELIQGIALFPGADEYTCLSRILDVT